jgi:hypothetical protein
MAVSSRALPKLTDRLPLGTSGRHVSPFCLGIVLDPAVVAAAFEAGINFFFISADMHWPLYEATRYGLMQLLASRRGIRDEIVIGLVSYATQPEFCSAPFREVIELTPHLGTMDLAIAGGAYGHEIETRMAVYTRHRASKYLGATAIGASFHDRAAVIPLFDRGAIDIGFVRYNPLFPKTATQLLPQIRDDHPLLFNFKSTGGWMTQDELHSVGVGDDCWHPHPTDYYRFALSQPALDGILCSLPTPAAVRELADAMVKGPLDETDHQYLLDLAELGRGKARLLRAE